MDTQKQVFELVAKVSKKEKIPIYIVGGFVRDLLMKREQKKDIDFVVEGSGLEFAKKFDDAFKQAGSLVEFPDFDTARYIINNKKQETKLKNKNEDDDEIVLEFAGARTEKYDTKSRKPKVVTASLEEDLKRRDFTVNAMAVEVSNFLKIFCTKKSTNCHAEFISASKLSQILKQVQDDNIIVDPFNGQADIKAKILRTPLDPDVTFSDDPLRMMRAVRFAAQLNFGIDPKILQSIHKNRERLKIISAERIQEELLKLLSTSQPSIGLILMFQTHLLDFVLPEVAALDGVEEIYGHQHKNNLVHTFKVVDNISERTNKVPLRLAALLHDIGKMGTKKFIPKIGWTFYSHEHLGRKMVREIGKRLRFSKDLTDYLAKLVRWHQQPISLMDEGITDSAVRRLIVSLGDELEDLLLLGVSDITTGNPNKLAQRQNNYNHLRERIDEVIEKDQLRAFQSPVRGEEIMEECGLKPGPTVGKIKKALEEAILDGKIPNEHEAVKEYFLKIKDKYLIKTEDWEKIK